MLKKFTKKELNFHFTPHLSPMFRGILSTIYIDLEKDITQSKVIKKLSDFYKKDHFVKILKPDSLISTNDVIGTNNCLISVCKTKYKNKLIILSAIDNLIKGGAGRPAPPLIRLSIAESIINLFLYLVLQTDMRQLFVPITSFVLIKLSGFKILTK